MGVQPVRIRDNWGRRVGLSCGVLSCSTWGISNGCPLIPFPWGIGGNRCLIIEIRVGLSDTRYLLIGVAVRAPVGGGVFPRQWGLGGLVWFTWGLVRDPMGDG